MVPSEALAQEDRRPLGLACRRASEGARCKVRTQNGGPPLGNLSPRSYRWLSPKPWRRRAENPLGRLAAKLRMVPDAKCEPRMADHPRRKSQISNLKFEI